jgi:hypothetical protein
MKKVMATVAIIGLLAGCGSLPPKVEVINPGYTKAPVYVAQLSYERFKRPNDWESDKEWNVHVIAWQGRFWKQVHQTNLDIKEFAEGTKIEKGLIVKPYVVGIKRRYNGWGGLDAIDVVAELHDISGEKVAAISYEAEMMSQQFPFECWTFGGRMGECADAAGMILGGEIKKIEAEK